MPRIAAAISDALGLPSFGAKYTLYSKSVSRFYRTLGAKVSPHSERLLRQLPENTRYGRVSGEELRTGTFFPGFFPGDAGAAARENEYFRLHTFAHEWYFAAHFWLTDERAYLTIPLDSINSKTCVIPSPRMGQKPTLIWPLFFKILVPLVMPHRTLAQGRPRRKLVPRIPRIPS